MEQRARVSSRDAKTMNPEANPHVASALRTLGTERDGVTALSAAMCDRLGAPFAAAVDAIRNARGRVIVTGMGKSGHVARKIAATFASTGTPAFFVHAADASHGDLGMITLTTSCWRCRGQARLKSSRSSSTYSRRFRITLIAITAIAGSTLGTAADIVLALPESREACPHNLAPTTSSLMQLALGDALAIALLESRGFTALEFGVFHPRGKLGAALKFTPRCDALRDRHAADQARGADVGSDRRDDNERIWLRRGSSKPTASSQASLPMAICAATCASTCFRRR